MIRLFTLTRVNKWNEEKQKKTEQQQPKIFSKARKPNFFSMKLNDTQMHIAQKREE